MNKNYCVYEHIFPNGKKYLGISSDVEKRWRNGKGYETQGKIANAIKCFGWENVKHNIIVDGLNKEQAEQLEKYLINELDTINNGYNTAIGGENITSTYLNQHILFEIRESKEMDKKFNQVQTEDSIVSIYEKGKYNKELAEIFNYVDGIIEDHFFSYKQLTSNILFDGRFERCEAYWYYARQILEQIANGQHYDKNKIKDYERYRAEFYSMQIKNE